MGDMNWRYCGHPAGVSGFRRVIFTFQVLRSAEMALEAIYRDLWAPSGDPEGWRKCSVKWVTPTEQR